MPLQHTIYDRRILMGIYREMGEVPNFWLTLAFGAQVNFDEEEIDFGKITEDRELAPLVMPMNEGRPLYSESETRFRTRPAYIKPKDPVTAANMIRRRAGLGELLPAGDRGNMARYNAVVASVIRQHRNAIERRWEWMAAKAVLDGQVTLSGGGYPTRVVDFQRPANHTVVLGSGSRWGDLNVQPQDDLELWIDRVQEADFGGPVNDVIFGPTAWKAYRTALKGDALTDLNRIQRDPVNIDLNMLTERVQFVGNISRNVRAWVYSDYYHVNGVKTNFMDPRDVLVYSPNMQGTRVFGAILDLEASLAATPVFPSMWNERDPSATMIMHQSAPLMVPVNPSSTLRARVVA